MLPAASSSSALSTTVCSRASASAANMFATVSLSCPLVSLAYAPDSSAARAQSIAA